MNSNHAIAPTLYMRQHFTLPVLFQVTHLKSRCFTHPRGFTSDRLRSSIKTTFSTHHRLWKQTISTRCMFLRSCLTWRVDTGTFSLGFTQIPYNIFWIVLKCALSIIPIKAHMWKTWASQGKCVGWGVVSEGENTCYILLLQTLISVFISFLCNLLSFMVELTQANQVQWFNTHVPFTCLVKSSKALLLSKMYVSLASCSHKQEFFWFLFITYISSLLCSLKKSICLKNIFRNTLPELDPYAYLL